MSSFELYDFDPLSTDIPTTPGFPLKQLHSVLAAARRHLRGMDSKDVYQLERFVDQSIDEMRQVYVEAGFDDYVADLFKNGGWELGYLPGTSAGTKADIRDLLTNWPDEADDRPNLPDENDLSRVEALETAVIAGLPAVPPIEKFLDPSKSAAVLALMLVAESLDALNWHNDSPAEHRGDLMWVGVCAAADIAIEAAMALGLAERYQNELRVRAELSQEQQAKQKLQGLEFARERARMSALRRHEPHHRAMEFVQSEWALHAGEYEFNKSAFSRDYVKLVTNQFVDNKGEPLKIKEKTIRDIWLSDSRRLGGNRSPAASKPTGKLARGE